MLPGSLEAGRCVLPASSPPKSERIAAFLRMIRHIPRTVWLWFMRVESRHAMAMLSDRVLSDIGLTRADLYGKNTAPWAAVHDFASGRIVQAPDYR
jgi:uncharacterized protein YjiS (DUF1127 family)